MKAKLFVLSVTLLFTSCYEERAKKPQVDSQDLADEQPLSFAIFKKDVFSEGGCVSCHSSSRSAGGINLVSYQDLFKIDALVIKGDAASSLLYTSVASGSMPPSGKMEDSRILLLKKWIDDGAPENSADAVGDEKPEDEIEKDETKKEEEQKVEQQKPKKEPKVDVNFAFINEMIVEKSCVGCHRPEGSANFIDLSDENTVLEMVVPGNLSESYLWEVIDTDYMPPKNPISDDLKQKLKSWIVQGAK